MRSNYPGVLGYVILVLGLAVGGLALVALGSGRPVLGVVVGAAAVCLLLVAGMILVGMSRKQHHDPLEPVMTEAGKERYEHRREEGDA